MFVGLTDERCTDVKWPTSENDRPHSSYELNCVYFWFSGIKNPPALVLQNLARFFRFYIFGPDFRNVIKMPFCWKYM